ncbi:uncharacterized protein LOC125236898 [Leguminivora glycinivorella]|uniref:uncharacterized protein LOC125236898 n=1 Tax=Leguminivora glycinivorella TaxID=1035111 RepID=UPI00200F1419|nr:uncharacterized protein LOC125236898 [Leguminivora glycinivorella]
MSDSQVATWTCPACCSKKPKGNNINTPVRKDLSPPIDNITRRKAQLRPVDQCGSCLTRADLTEIVRREIREAISESKKDNRAYFDAQFKDFNQKMAKFESSLEFINRQYEDFKKDFQDGKPELQRLAAENNHLNTTVQELTVRLNQLEQQARASNVEIQCVPEHRGENLVSLVQQLGSTIEHPVQQHEVLQCTRIAKLNPSNPRPRSILVKFPSPRLRDSFIAASRKYNKTHANDKLNTSHLGIATTQKSQVFIVEHMTKETKELHLAARLKAKEIGYAMVWVTNGRVYLRKSEGSEHIWVKNLETIKNLKQ